MIILKDGTTSNFTRFEIGDIGFIKDLTRIYHTDKNDGKLLFTESSRGEEDSQLICTKHGLSPKSFSTVDSLRDRINCDVFDKDIDKKYCVSTVVLYIGDFIIYTYAVDDKYKEYISKVFSIESINVNEKMITIKCIDNIITKKFTLETVEPKENPVYKDAIDFTIQNHLVDSTDGFKEHFSTNIYREYGESLFVKDKSGIIGYGPSGSKLYVNLNSMLHEEKDNDAFFMKYHYSIKHSNTNSVSYICDGYKLQHVNEIEEYELREALINTKESVKDLYKFILSDDLEFFAFLNNSGSLKVLYRKNGDIKYFILYNYQKYNIEKSIRYEDLVGCTKVV